MGDPHRKERYGQLWPQHRIDAYLEVLLPLQNHVALSGGWAWHFMSPPGHVEYKHAHDHKDLDLMVPPEKVGCVMGLIAMVGFEKARTRYDGLDSPEEFRRYEKMVEVSGHPPFKLTIDFFVKQPLVRLARGWMVVEPAQLLGFYNTIHSSKSCFAVQAAKKLMDRGIDPIGHPSLVEIPL
jgi:hypothetical protein